MAKKDINVDLQDGILTIEAKINEKSESTTDKVIRKEIRTGYFSRSINVGKQVNSNDINAELINGLLKLTEPKVQQVSHEKKIEIL